MFITITKLDLLTTYTKIYYILMRLPLGFENDFPIEYYIVLGSM